MLFRLGEAGHCLGNNKDLFALSLHFFPAANQVTHINTATNIVYRHYQAALFAHQFVILLHCFLLHCRFLGSRFLDWCFFDSLFFGWQRLSPPFLKLMLTPPPRLEVAL